MFGNILSKFTSPKVKADKFVQTFANVTSENKNVRQQVVREAFKEKEVEADRQANEEFGRLYDKYMPNAKNYESMH